MNEYGLKKKTRGQARQIRRVPVMTAAEAVKLVKDADVVAMCGCGGGINEATELICALAERYRHTQRPDLLPLYRTGGPGGQGNVPSGTERAGEAGHRRPLGPVAPPV